jgi:hypothetical protein
MTRNVWGRADLLAISLGMSLMASQWAAAEVTRLPFRSGFETGNYSEWQGGPTPTMSIVSGNSAQGQYHVQSVLTRGTPTDSYQDFYFGDHPSVGGLPVTPANGLWLSLSSKFDTGFQYANAIMHKIMLVNFNDENRRRRYQVIINVQVSTGNYTVEHLKWNADGSFNRSFSCCLQNVGTAVRPRAGQWDKLKLFIRPNTPGQLNGEIKLWVNGELKVDYANIQLREDTPYNPNKLILSSYESGGTASGTQRWDDIYLGETDPDATAQRRPNPPVIEQVR